MRDVDDEFGADELERLRKKSDAGKPGIVVLVLVVVGFGCMSILLPNSPSSPAPSAHPPPGPTTSSQGSGRTWLSQVFANTGTVQVKQDFRRQLADWQDLQPGVNWVQESDYVRPGRLRIWAPSSSLSNYDFEFEGQIDRKSLDWAFRAADSRNYYASKLTILRPDASTLVHYVVLNGAVRDYSELPLVRSLDRNSDFKVRLRVKGSNFLTLIDGQVVSSWNDPRISRGGVGFFSEEGERALLKWASLTERDSMLARVLSHFSILLYPPYWPDSPLQ